MKMNINTCIKVPNDFTSVSKTTFKLSDFAIKRNGRRTRNIRSAFRLGDLFDEFHNDNVSLTIAIKKDYNIITAMLKISRLDCGIIHKGLAVSKDTRLFKMACKKFIVLM